MTYAHERAFRKVQRSRRLGEGTGHKTGADDEARRKARRLTLAQLQYINARRSPASLMLDLAMTHAKVIDPGDPRVLTWIRHPGRYDVQDVDTPGSDLPLEQKKHTSTFRLDPLAGKLVVVAIKPHGRGPKLPFNLKNKRAENQAALEARIKALRDELAGLQGRILQAAGAQRTRLRRDEAELKVAIQNGDRQLRAMKDGEFLLLARPEDRRLVRDYARVLEQSFAWNPLSFDVAAIYLGTTKEPGVNGYTHPIRAGGYSIPFIAINNRTYDLTKPIRLPRDRRRRLTMIHEATHVARAHQAGRHTIETMGQTDYGKGRAAEEKYTVLETQLRAGSDANRRGESYYGFIPNVPEKVGAEDNKRTLRAKKPRIVRDLSTLNREMHRNAKRTYIEQLDFRGGRWTHAKSPQDVDRVLRVGGDVVEIYNEAGTHKRNMARFVDRLEGKPRASVKEYHDGHLSPLRDRKRRRRT